MLSIAWIAYWVILALLGAYGLHRLFLIALYWRTHRRGPTTAALPTELPVVTVQLPLFNEMYVAERLIDAVAELDWPHDKLHIQILDDSTDETSALCRARVAHWNAAGLDIEYLHRTDRIGFKAGALDAGLDTAKGQFILILDADFIPPPQLLRHTVGHFSGHADLAMVQVRWEHLNRHSSSLTRVQALLLDGHFVVEQTVRARTGRFFNFNGTAGLWRKHAIADAGGWHHDTLTEDLDLSYRALLRGWRFEYLLGYGAPAELPADMNAFKSQQFRWAKGSIQVARKLLPTVLRARIPLKVKLEALIHLTQNVPYLLTLLLILVSVPALALRPGHAGEWLWLHIPALLLTVVTLACYCATSQRALQKSLWQALAHVPVLMAITAGISVNQSRAVIEGAIGKESEFVRTPKHGLTDAGADNTGAWRRLRYRGLRDLMPAAELILAIYMASAMIVSALEQRLWATPFFALLMAGFAYVGMASALRR